MIAYRSLFAMGTRMELVLPDVDDDLADKIFLDLKWKIKKDESILSIYQEDSVFSRINKNAAHKPWKVDSEIFHLLQELLNYNHITLGNFDISLGLLKKEIFNKDPEQIHELLSKDISERILLDKENHTVQFSCADIKLDSGAFGKGYALDSVKKILLSYKIKDAFISFGDSSIATLGSHPAGDHWKIGIRDLTDDRENIYVFELNDGAVSTSGNTLQNKSKTESGHIFDSRSGKSIERHSVISVMGPGSMEAEILSTALFVAEKEERNTILNNFPQFRAVELVYSNEEMITRIFEIN